MAGKILFIVPYPLKRAPSQRFRVELFEPYLKEAGIDYKIVPFISDAVWNVLYKKGSLIKKAMGMLGGYLKRLRTVFLDAPHYDYIFIHREASPLGPAFLEWILSKLLKKKIIYDFDDAIWIPNTSKANKLAGWIKSFGKVKTICKLSYKVVGGNDYLCRYAGQYNPSVITIPTCVDVIRKHNIVKQHHSGRPVIGWTGSHSTLSYLQEILPLIRKLQEHHDFIFMVIADKDPELDLKQWEFVKWNEQTEIGDLLKLDIGIMPLRRDVWSEGKCGFKLIQYLALGIPAVADPIGVNTAIIEAEVSGYLCETKEAWESSLQKLLESPELRSSMGAKGRLKIEQEYSIQSQKDKFLSLFQ